MVKTKIFFLMTFGIVSFLAFKIYPPLSSVHSSRLTVYIISVSSLHFAKLCHGRCVEEFQTAASLLGHGAAGHRTADAGISPSAETSPGAAMRFKDR